MRQRRPSSLVNCLRYVETYEKDFKKWEGRVEKIIKRYRDEERRGQTEQARFNILWSNVQTLIPATFSRLPQPDVSRRFRDHDPVGRVAALLLERALEFEIQHYPDYRETLKESLFDRFTGGRGQSWVRYEPHVKDQSEPEGSEVSEDVEIQEELEYECAPTDYVHWKDFGHGVARTWEEVPCVWRIVYLTREKLIARFGEEVGQAVPLDAKPPSGEKYTETPQDTAAVYEYWDKNDKTACWFTKSHKDFLDVRDDPLELEGFFPCPKPLYASLTTDSLVPIPDYVLYQDQASELDIICDRIDGLVKALKIRGVYDASVAALARLFSEGENNTLIPATNWPAFSEKGGLKGSIDLVDIKPIADALLSLYQARDQIKNQIYEITGISDIVRGATKATETLGAQQIKAQYASLRLSSYQEDVSIYATELLRLKAQIMCKHFDPQTLISISSIDQLDEVQENPGLIQEAIQLLRNEPLRGFRIEIAADSLVQIDENQDKQDRMELLNAVGSFFNSAAPVAQLTPEVVPLLMSLLKFGVRGFKVGKTVEAEFDKFVQSMQQKALQPPQPDPQQEANKLKAQADMQRTQADMQIAPIKAKAEMTKAQASVMKANTELQTAKVQALTPRVANGQNPVQQ